MRRATAVTVFVAIAAALLVSVSACTLLVSTGDLAGSPDGATPDATAPDAAPASDGGADAAGVPLGASCRAIRQRAPDAGTGVYALATDGGGSVSAHCDMDTFGGGWTLVTPSMIVEDEAVQDYAPPTPARVRVTRGTDTRGGVTFSLKVEQINCGKNGAQESPGHYFLVGELDGWTQLMATYEFFDSSSCWNIFGDKDTRDTNVSPLNRSIDLIGPEENMSRAANGMAIPWDGRTGACDEEPTNFWGPAYAAARKSARIAMRRVSLARPAGLAVGLDCGLASWSIREIHVR